MSKNTKKKKNNNYNPLIISRIVELFGVSKVFIYQSLRGERVSLTSIKICEEYKRMEQELKKTIKTL